MFHLAFFLVLFIAGSLCVCGRQVYAASFQSSEQSAAHLGSSNSGTGVGEDPSVAFFNPAAMVQFSEAQLAVSGTLVNVSIHFSPTLATNLFEEPIGGLKKNPGGVHLVPSIYFIQPLRDGLVLGFSSTVPFGLATDYGNDSLARYFATTSQIATLNLNPVIAWQMTPRLAVGFGINAQYLNAELDQAVDYASLNGLPFKRDLILQNKGSDWAYGWNAGIYFTPDETLRLGLSYRSLLKHRVHGLSRVWGISEDPFDKSEAGFWGLRDSFIMTKLTVPDYLTLSLKKIVNSRWEVLGDVAYIHWSRLQKVVLNFYGTPVGTEPSYNHLPDQEIQFQYRNTWRVALGQAYRLTEDFLVRCGVAWDQTPVQDAYRTARIPDGNHFWFSFGANVHLTKRLNLDIAWARVLIPRVSSRESVETLIGTPALQADFRGHADLLGIQLSYKWA